MATKAADEDARWHAVIHRTPRQGQDVYAVRTTGVYCCFGCASRAPLRKNVEFFEHPRDAERAGYRACKRCGPNHPTREPWLVDACRQLESDAPPTTRLLAAVLAMSPSYVGRVFKRELGVSPQQYARRVRADRAAQLLADATSVTETIYASGHNASSRFYASSARELGMPPRQARTGGRGASIFVWAASCSLGVLLVAWTTRGVCHVALGDTEEALRSELDVRFPEADFQDVDEHPWASAVAALAEGTQNDVALPLDIRGTAFQERVWAQLRAIPLGETRSYGALAAELGKPNSARAIAGACAANSLALLIPCHRIVRADGRAGGYRWGIARKALLLEREAARSGWDSST
ncbi:MAG: methylated-DNA--[protein]-cysteine S-methyltransferase [Nannocystaceae bacterium]|nr:methylated-DNA--[protein]-cysteine S-methyltransferase [Nannocystaceae bacterium]